MKLHEHVHNLKAHHRHALLAANFFSVFGWALLAPLYALYINQVGGDAQTASLVWSFYTLLSGALMIALGKMADRLPNEERVLMFGYSMQTLGAIALLFADGVLPVAIAYGVYAVGSGLVTPVWKKAFGHVLIKGKEASEWGFVHGGNMLLLSGAAALSGVIFGFGGFKGLLVLMVVTHLVAIGAVIRLNRLAILQA